MSRAKWKKRDDTDIRNFFDEYIKTLRRIEILTIRQKLNTITKDEITELELLNNIVECVDNLLNTFKEPDRTLLKDFYIKKKILTITATEVNYTDEYMSAIKATACEELKEVLNNPIEYSNELLNQLYKKQMEGN